MKFVAVFLRTLCAFILLYAGVFLAGCQSRPEATSNPLQIGMLKRDVILLRGTPDRTITTQDREILVYRLHASLEQPNEPDVPYWVILENGKVVEHGRTEELIHANSKNVDDIQRARIT